MKTIGIQIQSNEATIVVLESNEHGNISQTNECIKLDMPDPNNISHVRQFRDQINSAFDNINPDRIGIIARNAKAKGFRAPSPTSFKLEGIIQLYSKKDVEIIWPQTLTAFYKKNDAAPNAKLVYQQDAFDLAHFLHFN
ncbi:MAG TPA: DUF3010 family protein [Bacteroidia bacterium]